jgi:hypothetical protein
MNRDKRAALQDSKEPRGSCAGGLASPTGRAEKAHCGPGIPPRRHRDLGPGGPVKLVRPVGRSSLTEPPGPTPWHR